MKGKSLLAVIGAVAIINLGSRFIGFFREVVIGFQFGTSYVADSVITAYTLPNFFYVVVGGAITTAFISIYSKIGDPLHRERFLQTVFSWLTVVLVGFTLVLMVFSEQVISLLFRGLQGEELQLTSDLFVIMAPSTFFLVLAMWLTGVLNVNQRFKMATASTFLMNASFVVIALVLFPMIGAFSHAYGAIISSFLMVIMLVYLIRKEKFMRFRFSFAQTKEMGKMIRLGLPILLGGATLQLYFLIHRIFASQLQDGAIAALNYSSKIVQLPQSVLMTAVTTVIYPLLAKKVAANEHTDIEALYQKGLRLMTLLIVPSTIFAFFYAEEIFTLVFEYGQFTRESTLMTAPLFQVLVLSMLAHSANLYITRFFYAKERSVLPVTLSVISVFGINVGLAILLLDQYGAMGLAAATTTAALMNFVMLLIAAKFVLKLKMTGEGFGKTLLSFIVLFISLILVQLGVKMVIPSEMSILTIVVAGSATLLVFVGVALAFRLPEMEQVKNLIKKRIVKRG
ncbi:murein biosynthesis integral membrane protein MurJ [Alkalihalophilus pseudofirmus]|uniref:Probable lipid II flippase MurJ n=1 Tax=Alkalihalophilus pseudofirmus TaxID=79885 RepID=A0AAJ2NQ08_ALKPS|nr:murein biosynthesis integral membrane protein MurJ [Alkalihalophilus pseudofirmus]MDV2886316.1 murein biosynthesis integral membrane protein MurJ [Alkalihalophilus pseudofirmus]